MLASRLLYASGPGGVEAGRYAPAGAAATLLLALFFAIALTGGASQDLGASLQPAAGSATGYAKLPVSSNHGPSGRAVR
jgi:hypothetical protein